MSRKYEHYALQEQLGYGGQAEVWKAEDRRTHEIVALKRITKRDPEFAARMRREIDVQTSLTHPNIMPVLEHNETYRWYTMPLAVTILGKVEHPVPEQMLLQVVEACANGLAVAHQTNNVHRDLTPNNILQLYQDGVTRWVVADWGLVRQHGRTTVVHTVPSGTFGTEGFAAPEMWTNPHSAGPQADVYSLGRVIGWCVRNMACT